MDPREKSAHDLEAQGEAKTAPAVDTELMSPHQSMSRILIIGAGPAGLVTARTLSQTGKKRSITIFESAKRVGGMWRARKDEDGEKCSPNMRTNLSRFTVAFSDLAWQSVDIDPENQGPKEPLPMFPRAHQVGLYLEEYARRFIPEGTIVLNRQVTHAKQSGRGWIVTSLDSRTQETFEDVFDNLVIASGFFGSPANKLSTPTGLSKQHSSKFRSVSSLSSKAGNVIVVGGSISGSEAAATAAYQISNAKFTPGKDKPAWSESKVYHVLDRPFYCLPRYLSPEPYDPSIQNWVLAPNFLPLDLVLYNASRRPPNNSQASIGIPKDPSIVKKGHTFLQNTLGGDQREFGSEELVYRGMLTSKIPTYTGISDTYLEFVRSGLIVPVQGRAVDFAERDGQYAVQVVRNEVLDALSGDAAARKSMTSDGNQGIDNVVGVIEATGYRHNLDYLSAEVKKTLGYDPDCNRIPLNLGIGSALHPAIPNLAFVGYYEGPYWAIMEQQARIIAHYFDKDLRGLGDDTRLLDLSASKEMRVAIKDRNPLVPHFWMSDYMGFVLELHRSHSLQPSPTNGPVYPALFPNEYDDRQISPDWKQTQAEVDTLLTESINKARLVAAAAFRAMQGNWSLQRKIDSRHASSPGGIFKGAAHFHLREPTAPSYTSEYLYIEEGKFTMDNGYEFPASRRYVYRYKESTDTISTWFVQEDNESAERLFNSFSFEKKLDNPEKGWIAKSSHWCDPDQYNSAVEFRFRGVGLDSFGTTYVVSGPNKDYTHESWYHRGV